MSFPRELLRARLSLRDHRQCSSNHICCRPQRQHTRPETISLPPPPLGRARSDLVVADNVDDHDEFPLVLAIVDKGHAAILHESSENLQCAGIVSPIRLHSGAVLLPRGRSQLSGLLSAPNRVCQRASDGRSEPQKLAQTRLEASHSYPPPTPALHHPSCNIDAGGRRADGAQILPTPFYGGNNAPMQVT